MITTLTPVLMSKSRHIWWKFSHHELIGYVFLVIVLLQTGHCQDELYPPKDFTTDLVSGAVVSVGNAKFLICRTYSTPGPEYRWIKDGNNITNFSAILYSLRIENVSPDDAGVYQCEAKNPLGSILSSTARVYVGYMEQFANANTTVQLSAVESDAVFIPIPNIPSYPTPTFTWFEGNRPIDTQRHHITLNGSLLLLDRYLTDSGKNYSIEALNGISGDKANGPRYVVTVTSSSVSTLPPRLVIPPENITVIEAIDTKAKFECIVNARPMSNVAILWYKLVNDTKVMLSSSNYLLSPVYNRTLTILSPRLSDAGQYKCEAMTAGYPMLEAFSTLTVYVGPTFAGQFPQDITHDFGENVTIRCQSSGTPQPTVHWYYNGQAVDSIQSSSYTLHANGSLTITQLDLEHAGMYQCFLRNPAGETSKSCHLKVNSSPPVLITSPSNRTIVEGEDARFPCETKGAPKPVTAWKRVTLSGGVEEQLATSGRIQILDRGELLIVSATAEDSGIYTCIASNSKGSVNATAALTVLIKTKITRPPTDQKIVKGNSATFPCGVDHDPSIVVSWQWSHKSVTAAEPQVIVPNDLRQISSDGTLSVSGINNIDIGNYTCHVTSMAGNDSKTVSLTVIELPKSPVIISVNLHATDVRGVVVSWSAPYDGNSPILSYSIQYNEVLYGTESDSTSQSWITYNNDIPADARNFTVSGLRPARYYQFRVFASNEVGESMASEPRPVPALEMPQQPPSSPPKGFNGMPASNTSVTLGWQPPNEDTWNGPLQGYTIQFRLVGYSKLHERNVSILSVSPRYELGGLAIYQGYELRIAAFNAEGVGVYSGFISVTTMEGVPSVPPEGLTAIAINSTTIKVSWIPPNPQHINGKNQGYRVLIKRAEMLQPEFSAVVSQDPANPTGLQTTYLYGLLKYTNYSITVLCYTSKGDGPTSPPVIVRTLEDVPSMVDSLTFSDVRDTSLEVQWTPPSQTNGVITGYLLAYQVKDQPDTNRTRQLPDDALYYKLEGLDATTKYTISVYASTKVGWGPARSADIESGVPPELPQPPYSLGVSNILANSVLLQFLPGYDGKTSITLWIVEALEGTDETSEWKSIDRISNPTATALEVHNLRPYTFYQLRIIAENIVGQSNASSPSRLFQTRQDSPATPPGNVTVRALNATALRVSWTPLSMNDWNGVPEGYKIYYRMKSENTTIDWLIRVLANGMNTDSAILSGLEEWKEYLVKMVAYNTVGNSQYSTVTVQRTRESVPSAGPVNVTTFAISSTSINVTWLPVPEYEQNGMILGFKVEYYSTDANIASQYENVPGNTSTSVMIADLRKFVTYKISVLAYTRMGDGISSSPLQEVRTLEDVPGPPEIIWFPFVNFTSATIEWEQPSEPNGIISGYMVSYKVSESQEPYVNSTELSPDTTMYTRDNLQRQVYYEFRVTAKTRLGWGETASVIVFTINNRSPPDSPNMPVVKETQILPRSVTITWTPAPFEGYGPLRNFTVQYKSRNGPWITVKETIKASVTTYAVKGLRPNTPYVFHVAATNDIGTSPYSVQSRETITQEAEPEGAPQNVSVVRLTTSSVKITWEQPPPSTWNGKLLGYTLQYKQIENENFLEANTTFGREEKILTGLVKFVNYEFLVKAKNSRGEGPASTPVTVYVGEAAPSEPPTNVNAVATNSTEIRLTWQAPPPESQNGILSGYKIYYWIRTTAATFDNPIISKVESVTVQNLEVYREYAFTVQAINLAGDGPLSDVIYKKTLEGLPGRPANISFWNVTYTSLDISWAPPDRPNGFIINYELSYLEDSGGATKLVKFNVSGALTHLNIKDLLPEVSYIFSVSARTSKGQGEQYTKRVTTGPQDGSPSSPLRLIYNVFNNDQLLKLEWSNGEIPGKMPIYSHIIQAKIKDTLDWQVVIQTFGNDTLADISLLKLNPGSQYRFRVYALNFIGISEASQATRYIGTPSPAVSEPERPFHYEWWFLVIIALTGLIIILVVVSLLCLVSRRSKYKKTKQPAHVPNLAPPAESEEGGFTNFEMTRQSTNNRRQKFASLSRNGHANNIYARAPPRPSPASVAYSDDDGASSIKHPLPDDDDDDDTASSCTAKPSELGDSTEPSDQESDEDSLPPPPPPPGSPPPPPFTRNPYISGLSPQPLNVNSWQQQQQQQNQPSQLNQQNSSFNAYQYTDSEAESSHYAYSLNGGQVVMNNTAGSRAPLPGFSSFV